MPTALPDEVLDAIVCEPVRSPGAERYCEVTGPPEAEVVTDFLALQHWSKLRYFADCARQQTGAGFDDAGFSYDTDELGPEDEPFTGVLVYMPWDEVQVGRAAFDRLLARFFRAVVAGATAQGGDAGPAQPWWPEFLAAVEELESRA